MGTLKTEKELLLWLVRLFRMDPAFSFSVSNNTACFRWIKPSARGPELL